MMNPQNLNISEKRIIFHILSLIMKADQIIDPAEVAFLDKVFSDFELDIREFDQEDLTIEELSKDFSRLSDDKKEFAKKLFFEMAACDGYVDPRETDIINQIFK